MGTTLWLWLGLGWLAWATALDACDAGGPCRCTLDKLACDCSTSFLKEVVLKQFSLGPYITSISVANCFHLHVKSNALSGLKNLQQINVGNVKQITLEEKAFSWTTDVANVHHTGLAINITSCNIRRIPSYSFKGFIRNILLSSVSISLINSYAFGAIDFAERIEFSKANVLETETQSFKKVSVDFLYLFDSTFATLPKRTMTDVTVRQEVRLEQLNVNGLETSAIKISSPRNFRLVKSNIGYVKSNAFEVHTKGDVSIHENVFSHLEGHAFAGFDLEDNYLKEAGRQDFVFENNTIVGCDFECLKINASGFDPRLDWIIIKQRCNCEGVVSWMNNLVPSNLNMQPPLDRLLYCLNPGPTRVHDFRRLYCNVSRFSAFTVAVGAVVVVGVLSIIATVVYCGVRRRGKKYINVPTAASSLRAPEDNKAHMLVVPDGKTYRETELHVILEHAEAIKTTNFVKGRPDLDTED